MRVLGNGLRTDHPIPGLPFVYDSHIPVEDPRAVEAIGRKSESGMWGRTDPMRVRDGDVGVEAGWKAFTTDATCRALAWVVRTHPRYGRSVWLVADEDAAGLYSLLEDEVVLWRAGGYWLGDDGGWHRPMQIFDLAAERYVSRAVPGSASITAAEMLADRASTTATSAVLSVHEVDPDKPNTLSRVEWEQHLEVWAASRPADGLEVDRCVVDLAAPELGASQLLNISEAAKLAGINVATLRSYLSRGENDVPAPQALVGTSLAWSRAVIDQWIESRNYTAEAAEAAVATRGFDSISMPQGIADVWEKVHYWLLGDLTDNRELRPGLLRRWRDRRTAEVVAKELSLRVAMGFEELIPTTTLAETLSDAILGEIAIQYEAESVDQGELPDVVHYTLLPWTARMLDWLIRHDPASARYALYRTMGDIGEQPKRYGITTRESFFFMVRSGLSLDGARHKNGEPYLTNEQVEAFLATITPDDSPIAAP